MYVFWGSVALAQTANVRGPLECLSLAGSVGIIDCCSLYIVRSVLSASCCRVEGQCRYISSHFHPQLGLRFPTFSPYLRLQDGNGRGYNRRLWRGLKIAHSRPCVEWNLDIGSRGCRCHVNTIATQELPQTYPTAVGPQFPSLLLRELIDFPQNGCTNYGHGAAVWSILPHRLIFTGSRICH